MIVTIGSFYKKLRLIILDHQCFQGFQASLPPILLHWQISIESKALSVETGAHQGQNDGVWTNQRHHFNTQLMGFRHHHIAWISNTWSAGPVRKSSTI